MRSDRRSILLRAGSLSFAMLMVSRLLGLLRESAQAAAFGVSGEADAIVLMLTLPDWLAGLMVSGALTYVLIPHWAHQSPVQLAATQRKMAVLLLAAGAVLAAGLLLFRHAAVGVLAAGLPTMLRPLAANGLAWSAFAVPAALLSALWATRLQYERDFIGMYASNIVFNLLVVLALVLLVRHTASTRAVDILGGVLIGAMLARLAWLRWRLPATSMHPTSQDVALPTGSTWVVAALASGLPLALPFVARSLASHAGSGALATFNYSWKLVELPLVLAVQLVATLAFPSIASAFAQRQDAARAVRGAFIAAWTLACAAVAALQIGAPAIAHILFGWGRMDVDDVARIATWGAIGAWGLLPQAIISVGLTVLATLKQMRFAVLAYGLGLGVLTVAGKLGWHDGAQLMWVLNLVLAGVALVIVGALVTSAREATAWIPWREMILPLALLVLISVSGVHFHRTNAWDGVLIATLAASIVVVGAWFSSPALRSVLRR